MRMQDYKCRCERCGEVFDERDGNRHVYNDGEVDYHCPICDAYDWIEVYRCERCEDWFAESELMGDLCAECFEQGVKVDDALTYGADVGSNVEVNALFAKAFTPLEINTLLAREFEKLDDKARKAAALKLASDDPYQFREWVRDS